MHGRLATARLFTAQGRNSTAVAVPDNGVRVSASTIYAAAVHSPRAKGTCLQDVNEQVGRGFLPVGKSVVGLWPMQGAMSLTWLYYR